MLALINIQKTCSYMVRLLATLFVADWCVDRAADLAVG